jgi:hypothetical protein
MKPMTQSGNVKFGSIVTAVSVANQLFFHFTGHALIEDPNAISLIGAMIGLGIIVYRIKTHAPIDFGQVDSILNAVGIQTVGQPGNVAALVPATALVAPGMAPIIAPGSTPPAERI